MVMLRICAREVTGTANATIENESEKTLPKRRI
jgi:hypothetical protein